MPSLRDALFDEVRSAGFDLVSCLPLDQAGDPNIREWLEQGYHGSMGWMERHGPIKADPAGGFPEYRSAIVVALEYGDVAATPPPHLGNISRYALGDDYHDVLKQRLHAAADRLRALAPNLMARAFVDTGPLNEKLIAARAGLGFVGKHTNLINTKKGSYFFLGLILVTEPLESPNDAGVDRCGRCSACIPACPTGAIIAPYVLDARRCISYLTIEHRGWIDKELRPLLGNRIFGCDDCQEVCPWNRFAKRTPPEPFRPREGARETTLVEWARIDLHEWRRRFRKSPVKRPGFEGFLRNVLVALGATSPPGARDAVLPFLENPSGILRGHAAWALGRVGESRDAQLLTDMALTERDSDVREEILAAAKEIAQKSGAP